MKSKNLDNPWLVPLLLFLIPCLGLVIGTILGPLFLEIAKDPAPSVLDQYGSGDFGPFLVGGGIGLGLGIVVALMTVLSLRAQGARAFAELDDH